MRQTECPRKTKAPQCLNSCVWLFFDSFWHYISEYEQFSFEKVKTPLSSLASKGDIDKFESIHLLMEIICIKWFQSKCTILLNEEKCFSFLKLISCFMGYRDELSLQKNYLIYVTLLTSGIEINIDIKYSFRVNK